MAVISFYILTIQWSPYVSRKETSSFIFIYIHLIYINRYIQIHSLCYRGRAILPSITWNSFSLYQLFVCTYTFVIHLAQTIIIHIHRHKWKKIKQVKKSFYTHKTKFTQMKYLKILKFIFLPLFVNSVNNLDQSFNLENPLCIKQILLVDFFTVQILLKRQKKKKKKSLSWCLVFILASLIVRSLFLPVSL